MKIKTLFSTHQKKKKKSHANKNIMFNTHQKRKKKTKKKLML